MAFSQERVSAPGSAGDIRAAEVAAPDSLPAPSEREGPEPLPAPAEEVVSPVDEVPDFTTSLPGPVAVDGPVELAPLPPPQNAVW